MKDQKIVRRRVLSGISLGVVGGAIPSKTAEAQDFLRTDRQRQLFENAINALMSAELAVAGDLSPEEVPSVDEAEEYLGVCLDEVSQAVSSTEIPAFLTRVETSELLDEIISNDLEPDPSQYSEDLMGQNAVAEGDSIAGILASIIAQTFFIDRTLRGAIERVLGQLDVADLLTSLEQSIRRGNWSRATRLSKQLILRLFGKTGLVLLRNELGEEAFKRLLISFGARAVPFVGWGLMAVSLSAAIYNNRERIESLIPR